MTADPDRRSNPRANGRILAGVPVRDRDIEPTASIHWAARLFRVMAGLLFVLMVLQLALGLTSTVEISYGVLFADAVRLLTFAGMLWAAGALADLFVKSHHDVRAIRILLTRMEYRSNEADPTPEADSADESARDAGYRH